VFSRGIRKKLRNIMRRARIKRMIKIRREKEMGRATKKNK